MLQKPFLTAILGIFFVFAAAMVQQAYKSYQNHQTRPQIISCLVYEGKIEDTLSHIQNDLMYVDRFVVLEPYFVGALKAEDKQAIYELTKKKTVFVSLSLTEDEVAHLSWESIVQAKRLGVFKECQGSDVLVFSQSHARVDYKQLYSNLRVISHDQHKPYVLNSDKDSFFVSSWGFLANNQINKLTSQKSIKNKKRHLFFLTDPPVTPNR